MTGIHNTDKEVRAVAWLRKSFMCPFNIRFITQLHIKVHRYSLWITSLDWSYALCFKVKTPQKWILNTLYFTKCVLRLVLCSAHWPESCCDLISWSKDHSSSGSTPRFQAAQLCLSEQLQYNTWQHKPEVKCFTSILYLTPVIPQTFWLVPFNAKSQDLNVSSYNKNVLVE